MKEELTTITVGELTKAGTNLLNTQQLDFILQRTPKIHKYSRPAKGGGTWNYVTGTYVKKILNLAFGWDWSFEIVEHKFDLQLKQAYVLGKLTVNTGGRSIYKMQFGRVDIKFKTEWIDGKKQTTDQPLDIGNDLKAAATDCLKKCASELGIASDVYSPNEFKEIRVIDDKTQDEVLDEINILLRKCEIPFEDMAQIEMSLENKEVKNYNKILKYLQDATS